MDCFDIPAILDRRHDSGQCARSDTAPVITRKLVMPQTALTRPRSKRYENAVSVRLHMQRAPFNGIHRVWAAIGWKWVHIAGSHGRRIRIRRSEFDTIKLEE